MGRHALLRDRGRPDARRGVLQREPEQPRRLERVPAHRPASGRRPRPGRPRPGRPAPDAVEDKNELVASGQAVAIVPAGIRHRPDLTVVPLDGVEPCHVVLATRAGGRSRLLADFCKSAEAHLTGG